MKTIFLLLTALLIANTETIFDFKPTSNIANWYIVDDVVMGGRSEGNFYLSEQGHGVFSGEVSLENNGGFSSVRYRFNDKNVEGFKKIILTLKGDSKRYQFRVKSKANERHSYITYFETTGEWETIEIYLKDLWPSWRGMQLDMANYPAENLAEIAFLIANNKPESFSLEINKIELK